MGRRWDGHQDATLRRILAEGATAAEAGDEIGRTARAVETRMWRAGIGGRMGRPVDTRKRAALMDFLGRGLTLSEAARRLGVRVPTVRVTALRLVKAGLLVRVGGRTRAVRYVPTGDWENRL